MSASEVVPAWVVLDWRRRTTALYAEVRAGMNPAEAHQLWVHGRDHMLREHPASPVPADTRHQYPGADVADYDPAYRFVVPVDTNVPGLERQVMTGTDGVVTFRQIGRIHLPQVGSLDVWWLLSYGGGLFVPIRDATSGRTSYGGGRYLIDTIKGADLGGGSDHLVADLNFAYQPSCAYDPAWACPLPSSENTIATEVPVGERYRDLS